MKVAYHQASRDDLIRQFRYYLVKLNLPDVAIRFREAVRKTAKAISARPSIAPPYHLHNLRLQNLRSWPVAGFDAIRLYFLVERNTMLVIRILHGKQDVRRILEREIPSEN